MDADAKEQAILKTVAETVLPGERWDEIKACLESYVAYQRSAERLWGVTHLG